MVDVESWTRRLEHTFSQGGIVGHRLLAVIGAENRHSAWVTQTFRGHLVLFDSFQSFALETFGLAEAQYRQSPPAFRWYLPHFFEQVIYLRRLRACQNLLLHGYPMAGYALLRDLKDHALFFGALGCGFTTLAQLQGVHEFRGKEIDWNRYSNNIRKLRMKEEERVLGLTIGSRRSLDVVLKKALDKWQQMFNLEVHGSRLSLSSLMLSWLHGEIPLPTTPELDMDATNMYLNRVDEIGWMLLRTYPLLQLSNGSFGNEWAERWRVLDTSFREAISVLEEKGMAVASAITQLVDKRFDFAPESTSYQRVKEFT